MPSKEPPKGPLRWWFDNSEQDTRKKRLVQACIDMGTHVIKVKALGYVQQYREVFDVLERERKNRQYACTTNDTGLFL